MTPRLTSLPRPLIVGVVRAPDPANAIAIINNSDRDGAHAYNLHLSRLQPQYLVHEHLRPIMTSTARPIVALNYRNNGDVPDEERVAQQVVAVEAGAVAVDFVGDILDPDFADWNGKTTRFDPAGEPCELSTDPNVVARQKDLFARVHDLGAEVMMSSHTRVVMTPEQVLTHAQTMASRGVDAIKIVSVCLNEEQMLDALRAIIMLRKELAIPFQYQCHGQHSKLVRYIGPMLGSMLVYCNQRYTPDTHDEQPLIEAMREVFRLVDWCVPDGADEHLARV